MPHTTKAQLQPDTAAPASTVEEGLERLNIAPQNAELAHEETACDNNIELIDVDPLSIDLPAAILHLLDIIHAIEIPGTAEDSVAKLRKWAEHPQHESSNIMLDLISGLLLAEGLEFKPAIFGTERSDGWFTAAVAGVFRPLVVDLVARWTENESGVFKDVRSIEMKVEAVAYASGILLGTCPQIKSLVMRYFEQTPGYTFSNAVAASPEKIIKTLVVFCRLIRRLPELPATTAPSNWDWRTPLIEYMSNHDLPADLRILACECLCLANAYTDEGKRKLHSSLGVDAAAIVRIETHLVHAEERALHLLNGRMVAQNRASYDRGIWKSIDSDIQSHSWINEEMLCANVTVVGGVILHSQQESASLASMVVTPGVRRNVHAMALATSRSDPVLLSGPSGSGKTSLIEYLAKRTGKELVTVHVSNSMDAKVLLGNYVTTQKAGDFEWRAGLLTDAVRLGKWVLVEDIDLAPADVVQTLGPLVESGSLFIPSRAETIPAHVGFRLFATVANASALKAGLASGLIGSGVWTRLEIESLESEMPLIIRGVFPKLADRAEYLSETFRKISAEIMAASGRGKSANALSLSDLIKWCTRINKAHDPDAELLFHEAIDCFTLREADYDKWRALVHKVSGLFSVSHARVDNYIDQNSPVVVRSGNTLGVGRARLSVESGSVSNDRMPFADTRHSRCLMERIAACVELTEPVLLAGETGTGKTTVVQHLATLAGRPLSVFNLSQQSDSSDLLGGFRPVDVALVALRLREKFDALFARTVSVRKNAAFLDRARLAFARKDWKRLAALYGAAVGIGKQVIERAKGVTDDGSSSRKKLKLTAENIGELDQAWTAFAKDVEDFNALRNAKMVFGFVEGALVKAARSGSWILLDEINLATAETLACLGGLLHKSGERFLLLAETGERVMCHAEFRLFACMNPANDVGKRELPPGLRNSFSEFFVHAPDANNDDLLAIIKTHLPSNVPPALCHRVIDFYRNAKTLAAQHMLVDGANQRPHYSLRTLTRGLTYARQNAQVYSLKRALYDGLYMTFVTQLENATRTTLVGELDKIFANDNMKQLLGQIPPRRSHDCVQVQSFWLPTLGESLDDSSYVITQSVETKINSLARAIMCGQYPVLIQGPTSAGKTSMVEYLAHKTGHTFVRINNHEHTDLQEYIGAYTSVDGKLVFEEGALVKALRFGHWLVLDELNLAPSDVLEALNRLLDDNRELVIPETQEVVRPHPHFMLFATQNPAGLYGGRKALSRAFRNRFVELHFDDIPEQELLQIIVDSCKIPESHASLLVAVYNNLTQVRAQTRIFEGTHGFITLRDLFRWANRHAITKDELAEHGYMLIAERVRNPDEKLVVQRAIEKAFSTKSKKTIDVHGLYSEQRLHSMPEFVQFAGAGIAWTQAMRRLFVLTALSLRFNESVLLVGETGCGKTTVCQMLARATNRQLHVINCHQNTESSDILGSQRPVRNRTAFVDKAMGLLRQLFGEDMPLIDTAESLDSFIAQKNPDDCYKVDTEVLAEARILLVHSQNLFAWYDGPLIQAMKTGSMFLMDELNLADDSVLERLNSVLEPARTLVLAENVGALAITARSGFAFVATMNPGGDYGKRELSPALRNRFTEIWAPTTTDRTDLGLILRTRLENVPEAQMSADAVLAFVEFLEHDIKVLKHPLSLRDYLVWAEFICRTHPTLGTRNSIVHGACMVLLDSIGSQGSAFAVSTRSPDLVKRDCVDKLHEIVGNQSGNRYDFGVIPTRTLLAQHTDLDLIAQITRKSEGHTSSIGVSPFFVRMGGNESARGAFALHAPTTFDNLVKVLRAMQVGKPLLLEGSPGVGKTTLVSTLARIAGHKLVRINLSDQTDLMDLFGTDLPVDDGFAWCDAPFLQALKNGDWVLLDEINLASQSVLEGLNSCLDHRGSVYISELDREFTLSPGFRLFAAQNPLGQGGGRKGLPRSFVNRFTQVYMDELTRDDLLVICRNLYAYDDIERILEFNWQMHSQTMALRMFGAAGAPWEYNLRDVSRFMDLVLAPSLGESTPKPVAEFVDMLYVNRMRTHADRRHVRDLYTQVFGTPFRSTIPSVHVTESTVQIGNAVLQRKNANSPSTHVRCLHSQLRYLEALMKCIEMRWMPILVGDAGIGKTAIVRWLAHTTGNKLVEFAMNSGIDTSEILGGFEQVDLQRHQSALVGQIASLVSDVVLEYSRSPSLAPRVTSLYYQLRRATQPKDLHTIIENLAELVSQADSLFAERVSEIRRRAAVFAGLEVAGRFEWVDGVLVEALVNGHWLLLDRANLCSPSVLDRLNGLLEPNGVLYVNEDPNRSAPVVPHPDFRIIMAVDTHYGELSRAMRNRGIEICMLPEENNNIRCNDQAAAAMSVGVPENVLALQSIDGIGFNSVVQHAKHLAERVQRGSIVVSDELDVHMSLPVMFVPGTRDNEISVASWQARLIVENIGDDSPLQKQRMALAVLGTMSPASSLAELSFLRILDNEQLSKAMSTQIVSGLLASRVQLASAAGFDTALIRSIPIQTQFNGAVFRMLLRHAKLPISHWHDAVGATLGLYQEIVICGLNDSALSRDELLQRTDLDLAYIESVLALVDGCDDVSHRWFEFAGRTNQLDSFIAELSDKQLNGLSTAVVCIRELLVMKQRVENLLADNNRETASELAVAFEGMQQRLQMLVDIAPAPLADCTFALLQTATELALDASISTKVWALVHPTTLADERTRAIEKRLRSERDAGVTDSVVEAISMLYSAGRRKDAHLIIDAISKYAESLDTAQAQPGNTDITGVSNNGETETQSHVVPAGIIEDVRELSDWHLAVNTLAAATALSHDAASEWTGTLKTLVAHTKTTNSSEWALLYTRLTWALNGGSIAELTPLVTDVAYEWHTRLAKLSTDIGAIGSIDHIPGTLTLPIATLLTLDQAGQLECSIADHSSSTLETRDLLRALTRFSPKPFSISSEIAGLVAYIIQICRASVDDPAAQRELNNISHGLLTAVHSSDSQLANKMADAWRETVLRCTRQMSALIEPATNVVVLTVHSRSNTCAFSAWIETGICMLGATIPRRPVDPAVRSKTSWEWIGDDMEVLSADLVAHKAVQRSLTGEECGPAVDPIERALEHAEKSRASIELVYRPVQTPAKPFAELWSEARNLYSNIVGRAREAYQALESGKGSSERIAKAESAVMTLLKTLEQFEIRVVRHYFDAYRDIAQPWCTYVHCIKYGLSGMLNACKAGVREAGELIVGMYQQPSVFESNDVESMRRTLSNLKALIYATPDSNPIKLYSELIIALLMRTILRIQSSGVVTPDYLEMFGAILHDAYDVHKRASDERRKQEAESAKLFKSKITSEPTDEEFIKQIFPDFEDVFDESEQELVKSNYQDLSDDTIAIISACHQYTFLRFANGGSVCAGRDVRQPLVEYVQCAIYKVVAGLHKIRPDVISAQNVQTDELLKAANLVSTSIVAAATESDGENETLVGIDKVIVYNFYKDSKPSEATKVKPLMTSIIERAQALLDEWPEHAVLEQIKNMAQRLIKLPVQAPLAQLLTGLEQLYQRAQDWEAYASKDVSIEALSEVAKLIVSWRQLELNSWPDLLRAQELDFARRPNEWWFSLYSTMLCENSDAASGDILRVIDQFIQTCPAGEFRARINMLVAFANHRFSALNAQSLAVASSVTELKSNDRVYTAIINSVQYYIQFATNIADHLARTKSAIKKDLAQYVKISTWRDVNPAALKESALRTHRHLARCVRKWREAMSQPVFQIIQISQSSSVASAKIPQVQITTLPLTDAGLVVAPTRALANTEALPWRAGVLKITNEAADELAQCVPGALGDVIGQSGETFARLHKMFERSARFGMDTIFGGANDPIEEFALAVVGDVSYFQNMETPSHLIKKQTDTPKTIESSKPPKKITLKSKPKDEKEYVEDDEERQRKIKQFWGEQRNLRRTRLKEILKALQDLGLRRHFRPVTDNNASSDNKQNPEAAGALLSIIMQLPLDVTAWHEATRALSTVNPNSVHKDTPSAEKQWRVGDAAFFKVVAQIAQLRGAAHQHSEEVNAQQIHHIMGLAESLAHHVMRDHKAAAELLVDATSWCHTAVSWALDLNPDQALGASDWIIDLKRSFDALSCTLTQAAVGIRTVSHASGWPSDESCVTEALDEFSALEVEMSNTWMAVDSAFASAVAPQLSALSAHDFSAQLAMSSCAKNAMIAGRRAVEMARSALARIDTRSQLPQSADLTPWTRSIGDAVNAVAKTLDSASSDHTQTNNDVSGLISEVAQRSGEWATAVMRVWQQIRQAEMQYAAHDKEQNMWGLAPKDLVRRLELNHQIIHALHIPKMQDLLHTLLKSVNELLAKSGAKYLGVINGVIRPWVAQYSMIVQHVVVHYSAFHKHIAQFALTILSVLTSVVVSGLGSTEMFDSEETIESQNQSGTGMGEGSTAGAKNVSDEIENEDQIEGLQGDAPDDDTNEPSTNEDAVEMQNDFDGEMGDADLETDDDDSDDDDDDEDENENQMDEQLGDVDLTDPTALDDKMWDDDEKEAENKDEDNKVDSKAQNSKKEESDIVAGDENDKPQDNADSDADGSDQPNDDEDNDGDDAELPDDAAGDDGESGDDGDDGDDQVNQDTLDRMAEVDDLGDQLEMPEDLDMGSEDNASDDDDDDAMDADMPDNEIPSEDEIDQPDNDTNAEIPEESKSGADENTENDDTAQDEVADESGNSDDDEASDAEGQATKDEDENAMDDEASDENEASDEDDTGAENPEDAPLPDEQDHNGADKPSEGVDSAMNMDGNDDADPNTVAESDNTVHKPSEDSRNNQSSSTQQQDSFSQQKQQEQQPDSDAANDENHKRNLEPERTLADVIEKWEHRLNVVMRDEQTDEDPDDNAGNDDQESPDTNPENADENPKPQDNSDFEHIKQEEQHDKVTLADITDKDEQEYQPMDIDEEDESAMDEDGKDDNAEETDPASAAVTTSNPHVNPQPRQQLSRSDEDHSMDGAQMKQSETVDDDDNYNMRDDSDSNNRDTLQEPEEESTIDISKMRLELEEQTAQWHANRQDSEKALELWQSYTRLTHDLSLMLTEQLRLILTPTQATQLKGDYRTGKRLNMKRIIPYIASEFRKDKIWLRRTKPARREYHVMVALDNSKSMAQSSRAVELAYETLALITTALTQLEVGQLSVVSFGETVNLLHPFDIPFDNEAGARILNQFTFDQDKTDVVQLMESTLQLFDYTMTSSASNEDLWRLQLVISDGVCQEHSKILRQVREAMERQIMTVFIVLDRSAISGSNENSTTNDDNSIMNTQHVSFVKGINGRMEMRVQKYLDTFPFKYYVVLRDINGLPSVLAETLRQYFSLVGGQ